MKKINKIKIKVNGKLSTINSNLSLLNYIKKLKNVFDAVIEQSVPISGNHIAFCK